MRTTLFRVIAGVALLMAAAVPLRAHHSFAAEFDANKPVTIKGTVVKLEWNNPHSWIHIEVKDPDGKVETWAVEGGAPNALLRRGWTKNSVPVARKSSSRASRQKTVRSARTAVTLPSRTGRSCSWARRALARRTISRAAAGKAGSR